MSAHGESDSDNDVDKHDEPMETESLDLMFDDEIINILRNGLNDKTAYRSVITEVEQVRYAYSQEATALNKAVIKGLIELPLEKGGPDISRNFNEYSKQLDELLEIYNPLLRSLKRDQKSQNYYFETVVEQLTHLLLEGKLNRESWIEKKDIYKICDVLSIHGVISAPQVRLVLASVDSRINPEENIVTPTDNDGRASVVALHGCKHSQRRLTNLSTPKFSKTFDYSGGKLSYYQSDDYLEIPEGAIPKGENWNVHGRIYTSLDEFVGLLKKERGEKFVAPVTEYTVEGGHKFKKPVKAVIHHSIVDASLFTKLSVYLQDQRGETEVPLKSSDGLQSGPWYEIDGPRLNVYTYHFTNIICKTCSDNCQLKTTVKGMLYGKMSQDSNGKICATLELYIHFYKDVQRLPVFHEVFMKEQEMTGFTLVASKIFPPSLKEINPLDHISVELLVTDRDWSLLEGSDFIKKKILVGEHVPCLTEIYDPIILGTFMLQGPVPLINGLVNVNFYGKHEIKLTLTMPIQNLDKFTSKLQQPLLRANWKLSDDKLFEVAGAMKPDTWYQIGLKLGLSAIELDHMEKNNNNSTITRKIFDMLREWRDRQPRDAEQEQRSEELLRRTLEATTNRAAIAKLETSNNITPEGASDSSRVGLSVISGAAELSDAAM